MTNNLNFFLIFLLVIFKILAIFYTEFNLFPDEAQYWLWSQTIEFGYYSKPPLLSWFIAAYSSLFGSSFISLKIFPIIIYFFTSFTIYSLCLKLNMSKKSSVMCSLTFLILPAVSLSSFLISTDLFLLFFWIVSMNVLLKIRNQASILNFLLLGLFLGLAFLSKYAAVYFLLCLFFLLIFDQKTLDAFLNKPFGVVVFLASMLLVLSPNLFWNLNNGWVTLSHTSDNANLQNLRVNLYEPLKFISLQVLMVGPIIFFALIFMAKNINLDFENKFLLIFILPIVLIVLVESFLVRANANWAAPALISLFVLSFRNVEIKMPVIIKFNFILNYLIAFFLFGCIFLSSNHNVFDRIRGIEAFSKELLTIIGSEDLVVSDRMVFSSISYELRKKNNKLYMPHKDGDKITNHFQITSSLDKDTGFDFYFIGNEGDISYLSKKNKISLIKKFKTQFSSQNIKLYEVTFK